MCISIQDERGIENKNRVARAWVRGREYVYVTKWARKLKKKMIYSQRFELNFPFVHFMYVRQRYVIRYKLSDDMDGWGRVIVRKKPRIAINKGSDVNLFKLFFKQLNKIDWTRREFPKENFRWNFYSEWHWLM